MRPGGQGAHTESKAAVRPVSKAVMRSWKPASGRQGSDGTPEGGDP
jgi:hypothetical protein